jgi:elongation factor Tu
LKCERFHQNNGYDGENTPIVTGSARCALEDKDHQIGSDSIFKLLEEVDRWIPLPERDVDKSFLLPVEDVYSISGVGTVVTGRIERGIVRRGDKVDIVGLKSKLKTVIKDVQMFHKSLDEGKAGDQLGALLRGVKRDEVRRGMVVCEPGTVKSHSNFKAQVYVLEKEKGGRHTPFVSNYSPQLYTRTADICAVLTLPEGVEMIMPGDNTELTLKLREDLPIEIGQRFTLREGNRTVGTGVVTEIIE